MKTHPTTYRHTVIAKTLHWGFILLFLFGLSKAVEDIDQLADRDFLMFEIKFALVFLFVLVARFIYMHKTRPTALPDDAPGWEKRAAKAGHLGLYIALASIAVTGLIIGFLYITGLTNGALINGAVGLHEFSVIASFGLIGIHIAAALYHLALKDGIWSSMVPFIGKDR